MLCTAPMLICDTCCAERPRIAVDALAEHPGEKVRELPTNPETVQLPKFPLKAPVLLLNVPVAPLKVPPMTVQVDTPQLSVPPPINGKEVCASASGIALSSNVAATHKFATRIAMNLRLIMGAPHLRAAPVS